MEIDHDTCYRAVASRDARFDGRFFTGVTTTGIYCRPPCPARTPKRSNVRFFACAAAAEQSGFRPCLRCRPETSPGSPAWLGASATVSRALRLIHEGILNEHSVETLAERLGIGARHLRRLFDEHLGTTPIAVAQTHRAHFAKKLIIETALPMTTIAFSAGFASLRRFHATIKGTFAKTPTELRAAAGHPSASTGLTLELPYREPFAWKSLIAFLKPRAIPGVEVAEPRAYRRTLPTPEGPGWLEVRPATTRRCLELTVSDNCTADLMPISERVRRIFDLRADPLTIAAHLRTDPLLRPLIKRHRGVRVPGAFDGFEMTVRTILGQQVSVKAATTLSGRLVTRFGKALSAPHDGLTHLFPSARVLARGDLKTLGLPQSRAATISALAQAVANGTLDLEDPETALRRLAAIKGIGPWTTEYVAMRAMGEPDAFPEGDLGLRQAYGRLAQSQEPLSLRAQRWRPWRAYAARLLWMA